MERNAPTPEMFEAIITAFADTFAFWRSPPLPSPWSPRRKLAAVLNFTARFGGGKKRNHDV